MHYSHQIAIMNTIMNTILMSSTDHLSKFMTAQNTKHAKMQVKTTSQHKTTITSKNMQR